MEGAKNHLWDSMDGQNLVVIHAGLNDVLQGREQNLGRQIEAGVRKLRATAEGVQIVMCTIPEIQGQSVKTERKVVRANAVIRGLGRELGYEVIDINREVYQPASASPFVADGIHYREHTGRRRTSLQGDQRQHQSRPVERHPPRRRQASQVLWHHLDRCHPQIRSLRLHRVERDRYRQRPALPHLARRLQLPGGALLLEDHPIPQKESITVLGLPINASNSGKSWMAANKNSCTTLHNLIARTAGRSWGNPENTLKRLNRTLVTSAILYVMAFLRLTKTKRDKLEAPNRRGARTALGLPVDTTTEDPLREARLNTLSDLAHDVRIGQVQRLSLTEPSLAILERVRPPSAISTGSIGPKTTGIAFCKEDEEISGTLRINAHLTPAGTLRLAIEAALENVESRTRRFAYAIVAVHADCQAALRQIENTHSAKHPHNTGLPHIRAWNQRSASMGAGARGSEGQRAGQSAGTGGKIQLKPPTTFFSTCARPRRRLSSRINERTRSRPQ
ncbi:hypothetical protein HPB47_015853 [Ixodes persulcatus]|uniref:Uncharacterized protein n=1 Tax=Ixodes persulcatus TaxID=34615 RepID=A0AC60QTB2_IXOPE|nr:hypothetical protein HPB47_015853 [Ixodes persulcatus]